MLIGNNFLWHCLDILVKSNYEGSEGKEMDMGKLLPLSGHSNVLELITIETHTRRLPTADWEPTQA